MKRDPRTTRTLAIMLTTSATISGCASTPEYGSRGPAEIWVMSNPIQDPSNDNKAESLVQKQRSWGWASQHVRVITDGSASSVEVGPQAQSADRLLVEVPYFVVSQDRVIGRFRFTASPQYGYTLPESWSSGIVYEIRSSDPFAEGTLSLPIIGVPTYGIIAEWIGEQ